MSLLCLLFAAFFTSNRKKSKKNVVVEMEKRKTLFSISKPTSSRDSSQGVNFINVIWDLRAQKQKKD